MATSYLWTGVIIFIIGIIIAIIGFIMYEINQRNKVQQPWYIYLLLIGGGILAVIGAFIAAISLYRSSTVVITQEPATEMIAYPPTHACHPIPNPATPTRYVAHEVPTMPVVLQQPPTTFVREAPTKSVVVQQAPTTLVQQNPIVIRRPQYPLPQQIPAVQPRSLIPQVDQTRAASRSFQSASHNLETSAEALELANSDIQRGNIIHETGVTQ